MLACYALYIKQFVALCRLCLETHDTEWISFKLEAVWKRIFFTGQVFVVLFTFLLKGSTVEPCLTASLLILLPCYYGHLVIAATPLLWPPCYYGHLDIIATSILWPPRYYDRLLKLLILRNPLIRPPCYYAARFLRPVDCINRVPL